MLVLWGAAGYDRGGQWVLLSTCTPAGGASRFGEEQGQAGLWSGCGKGGLPAVGRKEVSGVWSLGQIWVARTLLTGRAPECRVWAAVLCLWCIL